MRKWNTILSVLMLLIFMIHGIMGSFMLNGVGSSAGKLLAWIGVGIMLGGNSEYLAKQEMRKNKIPENLIEESNTYYETDDQEILRAREKFNELEKKYDELGIYRKISAYV